MKNKNSDDLDLISVSLVLWKRKLFILLSVITTVAFSYALQFIIEKPPEKIFTTSEVVPITTYEESKYILWNDYLSNIQIDFLSKNIQDVNLTNTNPTLSFTIINREILYDLFNEQLVERGYLEKSLKEFNFLKKEDYNSDLEYEYAINDLKSEIKIYYKKNNRKSSQTRKTFIQYSTSDPVNWFNYLKFIEDDINTKIRTNLISIFNNHMDYKNTITNYALDDLRNQISTTTDESKKFLLEKELTKLLNNKYVERLLEALDQSPFIDSEKFHAAKIFYLDDQRISANSINSMITLLLSVAIITLILVAFYVILADTIKKRK